MSPYETFAANMMHPDSRWIPEILKAMITDRQAAVLVAMPGSAADLAAKLSRAENDVLSDLEDMYRKGLAFKKQKAGQLLWRAPAHLIQFHDATLVWPEATEDFYALWRSYMEEEWPALAKGLSAMLPKPFTRVVPVNRSLGEARAQVLAPDSIRDIIRTAERLAVAPCTCRLSMKKCDAPIEVCIQVGRGADYTIDRGSGREVTTEEALAIVRDAETAGLVHVTMNKADAGHFICNCCGCCCQSFSMLRSQNLSLCDPSRFVPAVDAGACTGCGACVARCWFEAISMDAATAMAVVDIDRCLGCGQCAVGCPETAIVMAAAREPSFIPG